MKRIALLLGVALVLAACGGIKSGTVSAKEDLPAHDVTLILPLFMGETCFSTGKTTSCTPRYIWVPWVVHYDEAYALHLRDCRSENRKCKTGIVYVPRDTYRSIKVGDYYRPRKGDRHSLDYVKVRRK